MSEPTCQICGLTCEDAVCGACGSSDELHACDASLGGSETAPAKSLEPLDQGLTQTTILSRPGGGGL